MIFEACFMILRHSQGPWIPESDKYGHVIQHKNNFLKNEVIEGFFWNLSLCQPVSPFRFQLLLQQSAACDVISIKSLTMIELRVVLLVARGISC